MDPLRIKAMFRRSKALYELENYFRAAMDVSECLIQEPQNEIFKTHMEKVNDIAKAENQYCQRYLKSN